MDISQTMQVETVQGNDLVYLTLYPQGYDPSVSYPMIFMLHGFGANMYDLANLAGVIDTTGYVYVCPNAPIPVQLEPQMVGFAWTEPGTNDPQQLVDSESKLNGMFSEVMEKHNVARRTVAAAGVLAGRQHDLPLRTGAAGPLRGAGGAKLLDPGPGWDEGKAA